MDLTGTIRIDKEFAYSCPHIGLPPLRSDLLNLQEWMTKANAVIQLCDCIINAPSSVFWSSVALESQLLVELDRALENLPFFGEFQNGGNYSGILELGTTVAELYAKAWIVFLRLVANQENEGVNPVHFRQLVQQNRLLTLNRFRLYCGIYADQYSSCLKKIVTRLRQTVPVLFDEYTAEVNMLLSCIGSLHESIAMMNAKGSGGELRRIDAVFDFQELIRRQTREILGWCEMFRIMPDLRPSKELLKAVPSLVEDLEESLDTEVLTNLTAGSNTLLISLCRSINHLKQACTKLYIRFYENYADELDKVNLLAMLVDNHELLVRVADKLNDQLGILLQKCKLKDMVTRIHGAINEANAKKAREIIETLKEQGILIKLGTFASREIENKVEELASIFPYSKEFLHLVLRFYGYDHEDALANLIEPSTLPFQLRILIKDTSFLPSAEPTKNTGLRLGDAYQESDFESEPEQDITENPSKMSANDLVASLTSTTISKARNVNPVLSAREQRLKKTEERLRRLLAKSSKTLDMTEVHLLTEMIEKKRDTADKAVKVGGKTYTKFYKDYPEDEINQADKEILRQTMGNFKYEEEDVDEEYQKFKLEQQFEREIGQTGRFNRGYSGVKVEDFYNDDYEEGFEEQTTYNVGGGVIAEEKCSTETRYVKPIGPLGYGRIFDNQLTTKGRPPKKSQKYPQQPIEEAQPSSSKSTNALQTSEKPQQQQNKSGGPQATKQQKEKEKKDKKEKEESNPGAPPTNKSQQPKPEQQKPQQSKPQQSKPQQQKESTEPNTKVDEPSSSQKQAKARGGYTGGRGRMMKERHKGQFKQRGADKKQARANPF